MKLSLFTALFLAWVYGTIAGLVLPHGPLALALYGLVLLVVAGLAHMIHRAIVYQLDLARFRQEVQIARQLAAQLIGGN